jgi:chromate transport protein ChrA
MAVSFHLSSLIYLPLFFLFKRIKPSYTLLGLCVGVGATASLMIPKLLNMIPLFAVYSQFAEAPGTKIGAWLISGAWIITAVLLLGVKERLMEFNERNTFYLTLFLFSVIFSVAGIGNKLMPRLVPPLQYAVFFILPDFISSSKREARVFLTYIVVCVLLVWYAFYTLSYGQVVPYQTYWWR